MRAKLRLAAVAALLAGFGGGAWAQTPTGTPIRLGLIAEQTGALAFYGAETVRTAQLVVKQINEKGGILGRPVELIVRDSKTTVNEAVRQARDLIYTENVDFLLQSINSAECVGIANVATQAKKIFISNCANDDLTNKDGGKYIFRIMNLTTRTQGYAAADYIGNKLLARGNRYYTIAHDFAFGRLATAAFKTKIKEINPKAEFIGEAWPKMNEADYTPFITAMIEAKPDVVFFAWGVGAPFWQQSGPYGLPKKFAMVSSYWGGSDELQVLPKASVPVGAVMGGIPYYAIDNATNTEFVDMFRKAYGKPPLTPAYFEFVTLQALKDPRHPSVIHGIAGQQSVGQRTTRYLTPRLRAWPAGSAAAQKVGGPLRWLASESGCRRVWPKSRTSRCGRLERSLPHAGSR